MKKRIFVLVVFVFILAACGGGEVPAAQDAVEAEPIAEVVEVQPTEEPEVIPTETVDLNNPDTILDQWLQAYRPIFGENAEAMANNQGGQFGPGSEKNFNEVEGFFEFSAPEGEDAWTPLNTHLDEYGDVDAGTEQAILIKFQPAPANNLMFVFMGQNEFGVEFFDDGRPSVFWMVEANKEAFETELALQEGLWYYTLMAIDRDGNFRAVIWEDGDAKNAAVFSQALSERDQGDGYKNASWKFIISFGAPGTLKVENYTIYTFSEFVQ